MNNMWGISIKSGIITVLGLMAYGLIAPMLGWYPSLWGSGEYVVLALGVYSSHYYYKAGNDGLMTYKQGLKLGLIVTAFTGLVNGLIIYSYARFAASDFAEQLNKQAKIVSQQENIGESVGTEVGQLMQYMTPELLLVGTFISIVLIGFALTLIITTFSKQSPKA